MIFKLHPIILEMVPPKTVHFSRNATVVGWVSWRITLYSVTGLHARINMLNCLWVVFWEIQHFQSCITLHGLSLCVLLSQAKPQVRSSGDICTTNTDTQFSCETSTQTEDSPRLPLPPFGLLLRLSRSFVFFKTLASGPLGFSSSLNFHSCLPLPKLLCSVVSLSLLFAIFRLLTQCAEPDLDAMTPRSSTMDLCLLPLLPCPLLWVGSEL